MKDALEKIVKLIKVNAAHALDTQHYACDDEELDEFAEVLRAIKRIAKKALKGNKSDRV